MGQILKTPIAASSGNVKGLDDLENELRSLIVKFETRMGGSASLPKKAGGDELLNKVRAYVAARRARHDILGPGWLADPAWDIMLDLWICGREGRAVPISNACIAAGIPWTTGLRWIDRLIDAGFVLRSADPGDRRRSLLTLEPKLASRLEGWAIGHLMNGTDSNLDLLGSIVDFVSASTHSEDQARVDKAKHRSFGIPNEQSAYGQDPLM